MPKRTKADKWISYFERFCKLPEFETIGSVYDEMTFRDDYFLLEIEEKQKFWDTIYNFKNKRQMSNDFVQTLLEKVYQQDTVNEDIHFNDSVRNIINKIKNTPFNPKLMNLYSIIKTVPNHLLDELLTPYKVYCWTKFKDSNLLKLEYTPYLDVIESSKLFDNVREVEEKSGSGINESYEIDFIQYCYKIEKYFDGYGPLMTIEIFKNIQVFNNFLFCPKILSVVVEYLSLTEVMIIKGRLREIENQMLSINNYAHEFIFPTIIKKNLTEIRNITQSRLYKLLK